MLREGTSMNGIACVLVAVTSAIAGSSVLETRLQDHTQGMGAREDAMTAGMVQSQSSGTKSDSGKHSSGSSSKAGDKKGGTQKSGGSSGAKVYRLQFLRHVEGGIHAASPRRMRRCAAGVR